LVIPAPPGAQLGAPASLPPDELLDEASVPLLDPDPEPPLLDPDPELDPEPPLLDPVPELDPEPLLLVASDPPLDDPDDDPELPSKTVTSAPPASSPTMCGSSMPNSELQPFVHTSVAAAVTARRSGLIARLPGPPESSPARIARLTAWRGALPAPGATCGSSD
jgi:hypothetical protein